MLDHRFANMAIGEEELHDFPMLVAPDFNRLDPAMILGMDYLGSHHLWLSLTNNAFYIDSGESRRLIPPIIQARQIGGPLQTGSFRRRPRLAFAQVHALCFVETDARLTDCRVSDDGGDGRLRPCDPGVADGGGGAGDAAGPLRTAWRFANPITG